MFPVARKVIFAGGNMIRGDGEVLPGVRMVFLVGGEGVWGVGQVFRVGGGRVFGSL